MPEDDKMARVQLSRSRYLWLKLSAWIEDHPRLSITTSTLLAALLIFYATVLRGCSHFQESGDRWMLETFGGVHHVDRAVRTPDVVLSLRRFDYDRLDSTLPTAGHFGGTAFRTELKSLVDRGGFIRINSLDARLADPDHPGHTRFLATAAAFGMTPSELTARCWYSISVLLHLKKDLGDKIEIRLFATPDEQAQTDHFCIGRSSHAYHHGDTGKRLDIIVPRPSEPTGLDSFNHPGTIIKNRPENADVVRFTAAFERLWQQGTPIDDVLEREFLEQLHGKSTPRS